MLFSFSFWWCHSKKYYIPWLINIPNCMTTFDVPFCQKAVFKIQFALQFSQNALIITIFLYVYSKLVWRHNIQKVRSCWKKDVYKLFSIVHCVRKKKMKIQRRQRKTFQSIKLFQPGKHGMRKQQSFCWIFLISSWTFFLWGITKSIV